VTAPAGPIFPTHSFSYTLVVANPSQSAANNNVIITDLLPPSVTFASASGGGVYSPTTQMVTWSVPTLTAQSSLTFTLVVTVGNVPSGTLIINRDYGARSDQITRTIGGPPVATLVGARTYVHYLPIIFAAPDSG